MIGDRRPNPHGQLRLPNSEIYASDMSDTALHPAPAPPTVRLNIPRLFMTHLRHDHHPVRSTMLNRV
jgi:hypothetical protein